MLIQQPFPIIWRHILRNFFICFLFTPCRLYISLYQVTPPGMPQSPHMFQSILSIKLKSISLEFVQNRSPHVVFSIFIDFIPRTYTNWANCAISNQYTQVPCHVFVIGTNRTIMKISEF
uniref:Uncharacterized protein n=1 Tax=Opuntia streptacantha TaxID=393608 RepID=A0A7C8YXZ9_OPUST